MTNRNDAALRAIVPADRIDRAADDADCPDDARIVIEPRAVTNGGVPISHGGRVLSSVEALHRRQAITARQFDAGTRLLLSYQFGVLGLRTAARGCSAWSPGGIMDSQMGALADFRMARRAIGSRLWVVVCPCVCGDNPVSLVARQQNRNPVAVMELLRLGLDVAGDHYGLTGA